MECNFHLISRKQNRQLVAYFGSLHKNTGVQVERDKNIQFQKYSNEVQISLCSIVPPLVYTFQCHSKIAPNNSRLFWSKTNLLYKFTNNSWDGSFWWIKNIQGKQRSPLLKQITQLNQFYNVNAVNSETNDLWVGWSYVPFVRDTSWPGFLCGLKHPKQFDCRKYLRWEWSKRCKYVFVRSFKFKLHTDLC